MPSIQTRSSRVYLVRRRGPNRGIWDRRYPQLVPGANAGHILEVDPAKEDVETNILRKKFLNDPDHGTTLE